jgi:hypothetical protein
MYTPFVFGFPLSFRPSIVYPDGIREISRRLRLREMHFLSGWKN